MINKVICNLYRYSQSAEIKKKKTDITTTNSNNNVRGSDLYFSSLKYKWMDQIFVYQISKLFV